MGNPRFSPVIARFVGERLAPHADRPPQATDFREKI